MKLKRPKESENAPPAAPDKAGPPLPRWPVHTLILLALLAANQAFYHRTIDIGFLSVDDPDYVQNNTYIESLTAANLKHILTVPYAANYAPVNILSYALDVALAGGKKPSAIHLSNVLWHGWVVCMVYLLAFTIRAEVLTAIAAALLFMLHPAHVEVVAWISSRKDLVATGFAVLSMTCYLLWRRGSKGGGWWYAASLLSFLFASAGKQSVLLLPAVMLVWDILVERRRRWEMLADKIPFGLVTVFFGWMTWHAQPSTNQAPQAFVLAATQFANLWLLTGLGEYVVYRPAPDPGAFSQGAQLAIEIAAVLVWAIPLLFQKAKQPVRAALSYWILLQMLPPMVLSFIVPITDRYLFLASVGFCLLVADVAASLTAQIPRLRWLGWGVLVVGLAAIWGNKTWNYVSEWCDPRAVWYGAHFKTKNAQVSQFLGEIYHNAGDRVDGFVKSGTAPPVTSDLALARAVLGDDARQLQAEWSGAAPTRTNSVAYRDLLWKLAWEQYQESAAHRGKVSAPNLFMNRGRLLVSQGKFPQAVAEFQTALAFAEASSYEVIRQETVVHALRSIGTAYWHQHNYKEAQQWFLKAQAVQKKSGKAWVATLDQEVERVKALAATQQ